MIQVWNVTNFDVSVPQVGKVPAGATRSIPELSPQVQHLISIGFLTTSAPEVKKEEKKVQVKVGIMEVTVTPGPDGELGTPDDIVDVKPVKKKRKARKKKKDES